MGLPPIDTTACLNNSEPILASWGRVLTSDVLDKYSEFFYSAGLNPCRDSGVFDHDLSIPSNSQETAL